MSPFPDLYALVLRLRPEQGGPPPDVAGHQAQGLFLELVRQVDPELSNALHADALSKTFTVAVLPLPTSRSQRNGHSRTQREREPRSWDQPLELRATLLQMELFAPFTRALLQQTLRPAMRLGSTAMALTDVLGTSGSHPWAGYSAYTDLAAAATPADEITLEFVTPTAFGQATLGDGRKRLGILPTPQVVFGSLVRRWNDLAPSNLHLDKAQVDAACADTVVSRYRLQSQIMTLGKGPQKGFCGVCSYELPPDPAVQQLLTLLADAAFYLGIGMKTARGMGLCRRHTTE